MESSRSVIVMDVSEVSIEALLSAIYNCWKLNVVAERTGLDTFQITTTKELDEIRRHAIVVWSYGFLDGFRRGRRK